MMLNVGKYTIQWSIRDSNSGQKGMKFISFKHFNYIQKKLTPTPILIFSKSTPLPEFWLKSCEGGFFSLTLFVDRSPLIPAVAGGSAQRCLEDFAIAWRSPADELRDFGGSALAGRPVPP